MVKKKRMNERTNGIVNAKTLKMSERTLKTNGVMLKMSEKSCGMNEKKMKKSLVRNGQEEQRRGL